MHHLTVLDTVNMHCAIHYSCCVSMRSLSHTNQTTFSSCRHSVCSSTSEVGAYRSACQQQHPVVLLSDHHPAQQTEIPLLPLPLCACIHAVAVAVAVFVSSSEEVNSSRYIAQSSQRAINGNTLLVCASVAVLCFHSVFPAHTVRQDGSACNDTASKSMIATSSSGVTVAYLQRVTVHYRPVLC
jgi:hypothetical protein